MRSALARLVLFVVPLGGCQLLFKLDGSSPDAGEREPVTGQIIRRTALFDASLMPTVADLGAGDTTLRAWFGDDANAAFDVPVSELGGFTFERPAGATYTLELGIAGARVNTVSNAAMVLIGGQFAGRSPVEPITRSTTISLPAKKGTGARLIGTLGQWTRSLVQAPASFDWLDRQSTGNLPTGALNGAAGDLVWVAEFIQNQFAPGQTAISHSGLAAPGEMLDGVPLDLTSLDVQARSSPNGCIRVVVGIEGTAQRMAMAAPEFSGLNRIYNLATIPSLRTGIVGSLNISGQANLTTLAAEIEIPYFDPLPNHTLLATIGAQVSRPFSLPDATDSVLFAGFVQDVPAPRGLACEENMVAIDSIDLAIPHDIRIDDRKLTVDREEVVIRASGVELTWEVDGEIADTFDVTLTEALPDAKGIASLVARRQIRTVDRGRVVLPADAFVAGHTYLVNVSSFAGLPNAGAGDFVTLGETVATANNQTLLFVAR